MAQKMRYAWPALLIIAASLFFLIAGLTAPEEHRGPPPGQTITQGSTSTDTNSSNNTHTGSSTPRGPRPDEGSKETFTLLGNIAILLGAVSFAWLRLRKKMASKSKLLKRGAKSIYKVHQWAGWAALILIAIHGIYFLKKGLSDGNVRTGLAAFTLLLGLGIYGLVLRKIKKPVVRSVHRYMSFLWIIAIAIHGGGLVFAAAAGVIAIWAAAEVLDRRAKPLAKAA